MASGRLHEKAGQLSKQGNIMLGTVVIWLIVGGIAGWLASQIMTEGGFGMQGDIIIGVVGALIGGLLFPQLGLFLGGGPLANIINASLGSVIGIFVSRYAKKSA